MKKKIVERYRNQPFALIGINGDFDETKVKAFIRKNDISWTNIPNGPWPTDSCISKRWNVLAWPSYYVIDTYGKIAYRSTVSHESTIAARNRLTAAIDAMLADQ